MQKNQYHCILKLKNTFNNMSHSEYLLHYIWKYRLLDYSNLETTDGQNIEIIDPGLHNSDAGPDFFNAKVKIDNRTWAGNIEIHLSSDDWYKHNHHLDKAYNSTILHVVENVGSETLNEGNQVVPQMKIRVPDHIKKNAETLLKSRSRIPCSSNLPNIKRHIIRPWIGALGVERLERKTNDIFRLLDRYNNSWDDAFYVLLCRNYGFGLNSDEFERLAMSLGYNIIQRHGDNLFQVEALLYGQAGMLADENLTDEYYMDLQREYKFLAHKYQLKPLSGFLFKNLRVRPSAFPQVRIAQLAALLVQSGRLFSSVIDIEDYKRLRLHFQSQVSKYWQTHYTFGRESKKQNKIMGDSSLDIILINTVSPILFAYGKKRDQEKYCDRAMMILESIKPERNSITKDFEQAGIKIDNAYDSQAVIQLKKEYCDKRKCLYCKIGYQIMSK